MITIKEKSDCCGCLACVSACPQKCIQIKEDNEGFLYPEVDKSQCINCSLCQRSCPILNQLEKRYPLNVYAAKNKDEQIRQLSSSGGIFTLLAERIIDEGGVVFGARFNSNWDVIHDYTETKEGLTAFRGSKYVQSYMGDCYQKAKSFLQQGRKVMYTGTPCQIAGLKNYLRKDYDSLLTVDVVCHGVPSPKIWRMYLDEIARKVGKNTVLSHPISEKPEIKSIDFRSKSTGWKKYSFALTLSKATADGEKNTVLLSSIFTENPYMNVFLSNLSLRPSCYACPAKSGKSGSDITLADFWGIEDVLPEFDDDKGASIVMVLTPKGYNIFNNLSCNKSAVTYSDVIKMNKSIETSVNEHPNRKFLFHLIRTKRFNNAYDACMNKKFYWRIWRTAFRRIRF